MLINCPECHKEVSDKASACPNCGYNIGEINTCRINGVKYDLTDVMEILPRVGNKTTDVDPPYIVSRLSRKTLLQYKSCTELANIILETKKIPDSFQGLLDPVKLMNQDKNEPKCPTCKSLNIQKIGDLERGVSVATLGIFSKKINKTYKCKKCGYMW